MNMILFIKAATAAPGQHDLFAGPVHVEGYVRAGKMVAGYDARRKRAVNENPLPAAFAQHADHPHMDRKIGELAAENNGIVGHMIHEGNRADIRYKGGKMGVYVKDEGKTHRISDLGEPSGHTTLRTMSHAIAGGMGPKVRYQPVGAASAARDTPTPTHKVTPAPAPKAAAEPAPAPAAAPAAEPARKKRIMFRESPAPGTNHFYVSAIDGPKLHLVAGPYGSHQDALAMVDHVRRHADEQDPRAHWMAWGTSGTENPVKTPLGENWKP